MTGPRVQKRKLAPRAPSGGKFITLYNPQVALEMVERVSAGETISGMCSEEGSKFPSRQTFNNWVVKYPDLARAYHAARELSATSFEEEAIDLARYIKNNPESSTMVRAYEVAMNQLRWSAARRDPGKFGDKTNVSIRVPVQINTVLDLGGTSGPTLTQGQDPNIYTLQARVEQVLEEGEKPEQEEDPFGLQTKPNRVYLNPDRIDRRRAGYAKQRALPSRNHGGVHEEGEPEGAGPESGECPSEGQEG